VNTNQKPATALPWRAKHARPDSSLRSEVLGPPHADGGDYAPIIPGYALDVDYAAHSANAYPRLVEALALFVDLVDKSTVIHTKVQLYSETARESVNEMRALLRELGEAS